MHPLNWTEDKSARANHLGHSLTRKQIEAERDKALNEGCWDEADYWGEALTDFDEAGGVEEHEEIRRRV